MTSPATQAIPQRRRRRDEERESVAPLPGADLVSLLLADLPRGRTSLLPLLHAIQHDQGYVDDAVIPAIAVALNISRADVHGVVTFYHDFRRTPGGRCVIKICRAESCRARGAMTVEHALVAATSTPIGSTSADGAVTLDRIHCFGLCATGPNLMIDGELHSRVAAGDVAGLLRGKGAR